MTACPPPAASARDRAAVRHRARTEADGRPFKITFGEMREMGLRRILVHCHCGHHIALSADRSPDDIRLCDVSPSGRQQGS